MDWKTALDIFRLVNMGDKNDDQIMTILSSADYAKGACQSGVSLLKSDENVLKIMSRSFYDEETCIAALKVLKLENLTENKLLVFIDNFPAGNSRDTIKKLSIPYFKLKEKKEHQIINLLKKVRYDFYFKGPLIEALKLSKKDDEELQSIIELSDFQDDICRAVIEHFKGEEYILCLMERKEISNHVLSAGAKRIKWEGKDEGQIMHTIKRGQYSLGICEAGLSFLKMESNILYIMGKGEYSYNICNIGIPLLNLDKKTPEEHLCIMAASKYVYQICDACLSFFNLSEESDESLLEIMDRTKYSAYVCMKCIKFLKNEADIFNVIYLSGFQVGVCRNGLPLLTDQKIIKKVMYLASYDDDVCAVGITLLTDEKIIFDVMEKSKFEYKVCAAGVKTLAALKAKTKTSPKKKK